MAILNLTTFTEVDSAGDLTVTSAACQFSSMQRDADSYVYWNYGAGFLTNFRVNLEFQITNVSGNAGTAVLVAISDTIGSLQDTITATDGIDILAYANSGDMQIHMTDRSNSNTDFYTIGGTSTAVLYCTFERKGTTATFKIYSDSNRSTLVDTLTITCESTAKRYFYVLQSRYASGSDFLSGYMGQFEFTFTEWGNISEGIGFGDSAYGFNLSDVISEGIGFGDQVSGGLQFGGTITDGLTIGDLAVAGFEFPVESSDGLTIGDSADCINWSAFLRENYGKYLIRFYVTLTGADDGESDQELPFTSFQSTKRNGDATYLSVIVPGLDYSSAVTARSNGDLRIDMVYLVGGVEDFRENIIEVDLASIRIDEGARSGALTLSGSRVVAYGSNLVTLENPIYKYVSDGKIRYRFLYPDPWVNPGDVVKCRNDEFVVQYINYTISDRYKQMEVSEI